MANSDIGELMKSGEAARLIPVASVNKQEARATSIFLATLTVVENFASGIFSTLDVRVGKRAKIDCYTEVVLPHLDNNADRPDGLISINSGKRTWHALVEAKVGNAVLDEEQLLRYAAIAKSHKIDAIVTISNQFSVLPTHHPVKFPKSVTRHVSFFHWSWTYIVTQAILQLKVEQNIDPEQRYILEEMVRFFDHPSSGVRAYDSMNREWKDLCLTVKNGGLLLKSSDIVQNTVGAWYQKQRDMSLLLTRELGVPVSLRLSKAHKENPEQRLKDDSGVLSSERTLTAVYLVPDAASPIELVADIKGRTLNCSMKLAAPEDRKSTKARVNWLLRQLQKCENEKIMIHAGWPGRSPNTHKSLAELRENPGCLQGENPKLAPSWFQVTLMEDLAGKFSGSRTFLESVSKVVPRFYQSVGQHLRAWVPPPPKLKEQQEDKEEGTAPLSRTKMAEVVQEL